jgi:hypothetical protein
MKRLSVGIIVLLLSLAVVRVLHSNAVSKEPDNKLKVELLLEKLNAVKLVESGGDELYFAITAYHSDGEPTHFTIPDLPVYWDSTVLPSLKNISLWQASLARKESVELVVSLVEHDAPPWNLDDEIGAFKVRMLNNNGRLIVQWHQGKVALGANKRQSLAFSSEQSEYTANFKLSGD